MRNSITVCFLAVFFCITPQLYTQETRSTIFPLPEQAYIAEFYFNRGEEFFEAGEYDKAVEEYSKAIEYFSMAILLEPDNVEYYFSRGIAYYYTGEYDRAIENYTQAILLDPNDPAVFNFRGFAYFCLDEFSLAIEDYTQVILLDPNYERAFINRGNTYVIKGEYDRAIEDYTQAILLYPDDTTFFEGLGIAYSYRGEYDRAIEYYTQAIILNPNHAGPYHYRGDAYLAKGEYDLAIEDYTQAILQYPNFGGNFNNRGIAYSFIGEYDRAIEDYTQAILLNPNDALAYLNRGIEYSDKGEYERAIEDYTQAILIDSNFAGAFSTRANTYRDKGEYDRAIEDYKTAIEIAETAINLNEIFDASLSISNYFYEEFPYLNNDIEAGSFLESFANLTMDSISRSINRAEQVRSNLGARGSAIMAQALYFYYIGVDFEAHFGTLEKVFEYSESLRSRGFLDQMGTEAALRLPGISQEERQKVQNLTREIENRQNILETFRVRPPQTTEEQTRFVNAGQTLSLLEAELAALDADISNRIPNYAELRNPKPISLSQAQEWLTDDTAVLIYTLWDESIDFTPIRTSFSDITRPTINSYCLVLTKDGLVPVFLNPEFDYITPINRLRNNIMRLNRIGTMETDRNALYKQLIKPVLPHLPEHIQNLIIVPDGTLGHLPFDILREDLNSPDFGETYRLSLSPSVSISMLSERVATVSLPIIAFGGAWYNPDRTSASRGSQRSVQYETGSNNINWLDLPGTEAEVQILQQLVPSAENIRLVLGGNVSEEHIKQLSADGELANYPILHFATHGYFREEDLERAGIVLSEVSGLLDNDEDGYLTIPEIALLNLDARIIMLSACETGLGILRRGDGMVGMARAFMIAGAENVGVSLWEIDDATTLEFMTRLYTKVLHEGQSFRDAYYAVKNEFRHNEELGHPFYWAAFTMYE